MRWSQFFLQTVREVPGDAEAVSHVLLARAGMMRRVAAGIYSLTPLGLRSHRKTEAIVREEMNRTGALEVEL
ncbi:MAG: proline--tRNA ligase, partial [Thermoanaerobaculia bacterium]|nr:proline--tRNA ligase [Thermoanaerobaculia bacterium]